MASRGAATKANEAAALLQRAKPGVKPRQRLTTKPAGTKGSKPSSSSPWQNVHHAQKASVPVQGSPMSPRLMTIFGVSIIGIGTYCGYLYSSYRQAVVQSQTMQTPTDVSDRYDKTAPGYDDEVALGEWFMGLGKRRKELIRMARGDVLEVSCGTGRNMHYYQLGEKRGLDEQGHSEVQGCRSVTFVDLSAPMVEIARQKFRSLYPGFEQAAFRTDDARTMMVPSTTTITLPENQTEWRYRRPHFDTVLETMGLCSTPDPVGLLRHLGSITEPKRGRILLLEHGRSDYEWVNTILDNLASLHADRHGCWWNRDIGQIVEESGLEVVEIKRYHLGTTWRVVLRPVNRD